MNIPKSIHKLPDAPPAVARAQAEAELKEAIESAIQAQGGSSAEAAHESEHLGGKEDTLSADCQGKGKPTIVDLFPEHHGKGEIFAQTLRYPEDGEPIKPPVVRTAAMGEYGDDFGKPMLRTAAMGEQGDDFGKQKQHHGEDWGNKIKPDFKPWFEPPMSRTLTFPENGEGELIKKFREGQKPFISPPQNCLPEKDFPMDFNDKKGDDFQMPGIFIKI